MCKGEIGYLIGCKSQVILLLYQIFYYSDFVSTLASQYEYRHTNETSQQM